VFRISLQEQPLQVLAVVLEQAGDVVTRNVTEYCSLFTSRLDAAGLENKLKKVPLSQAIADFAECRSFGQVAARTKVHGPDVRAMSQAGKHPLHRHFTCQEYNKQELGSPEQLALSARILVSAVD
jgi:hypothetical protein